MPIESIPVSPGRTGAAASGPTPRLSEAEFAERFREASRSLWCIAAAVIQDRSRAEDVVQDAAVVALGKLHEFDAATSFLAWMGQIVRFVALNQGRKMMRERAAHDAQRHDGMTRPMTFSDLTLDARVERALAQLDETARACLLLRTVMGLSHREIAAAVGVPEGTAMSHVFRARKAMRGMLGDIHRCASGEGAG